MSRDGRHAKRRLLRMVAARRPVSRRLSTRGWVAVGACAAGLLFLLQPQHGNAATGGVLPALGGGDPELAAAVSRGAEWLLVHQDPDGRWDADGFAARCKSCDGAGDAKNDVGVTALALLAL